MQVLQYGNQWELQGNQSMQKAAWGWVLQAGPGEVGKSCKRGNWVTVRLLGLAMPAWPRLEKKGNLARIWRCPVVSVKLCFGLSTQSIWDGKAVPWGGSSRAKGIRLSVLRWAVPDWVLQPGSENPERRNRSSSPTTDSPWIVQSFPTAGWSLGSELFRIPGCYVGEGVDKSYWKEMWAGYSVNTTRLAGVALKLCGLTHMHFCYVILRHRN